MRTAGDYAQIKIHGISLTFQAKKKKTGIKTKKVLILAFEFCSLYCCYYYKHLGHIPLFPPTKITTDPSIIISQKKGTPYHNLQLLAFSGHFSVSSSEQTSGERGSGNKGKGLHTYGFKRNHQITSARSTERLF